MKKNFIGCIGLLAIILGSNVAQAGNGIHCLDAGGYYGNIQVMKNPTGLIEIDAEQGFAMEISSQLGAPQDQEASRYTILLNPQQCAISPTLIQCQGLAKVIPQRWSQTGAAFSANIKFQLTKTPADSTAALLIGIPNTQKVGKASHRFALPLGQCR